MKQRTFEFIKAYLNEIKPITLNDEEMISYRYLDAGHIDSFGLIQFIMAIEEEFNITLEAADTESDEFRYVGGLVDIIESKL